MAFDVRVENETNRIFVTLSGFATVKEVSLFEHSSRSAISMLAKDEEPHQILYDVSDAKIQSQSVVEALRSLALNSPRTSAFALVNSSALAGRQISRIFAGIDVHIARNREAAIVWLDKQAENLSNRS